MSQLDPLTLLVVCLGALVGGGLALLVWALTPREVSEKPAEPNPLLQRARSWGRRGPLAVLVGLLVLLLTGWWVAAIAIGCLVLGWDAVFGGANTERVKLDRLEALAAWTESLRDTIAGAVGLEQAIPSTTYAAAPAISSQLVTLSDRLRVRVPLPVALRRFAEELDDSSADLIVAALILNSRLRGPGLREVLSSLSTSARAELDMRQRVLASRKSTRRSVVIVVGVTLAFVIGLRLVNPEYVAPYDSPTGQMVMLVVIAFFAAGILWLRRLSKFDTPERFLRFRTAQRPSPRASQGASR